jgi:hypothetical protein
MMLTTLIVATALQRGSDSFVLNLKLEPRFQVKGLIWLGGDASESGRRAVSDKLFLVKGSDRTVLITNLNDLEGSVHIRSGTEALAFLRLQTCPLTASCFEPQTLELIPRANVDPDYVLGSAAMAKFLRESRGLVRGVFSGDAPVKEYVPLEVRSVADQWLVKRTIMTRISLTEADVRVVNEQVYASGKVVRKVVSHAIYRNNGFLLDGFIHRM